MEFTGHATKTEAIHFALREVDRRARLQKVLEEGTGVDSNGLKAMFDPASDPIALRVAESSESYPTNSE